MFVMDIEQDLARRDLTINAIAYDPINYRIADPFSGVLDLKSKLIKAVGKPKVRFQEDGLRIMRVARFAARFGYAVDQNTFQGMKDSLDTLKKVSKERINDELKKTLMSENASYGLQILQSSGALDIACPLLADRQLPLLPHQDACKGPLEAKLAFLYNKLPIKAVQEELMGLKFSNKEIKKTLFFLELIERFYVCQKRNTIESYKSFMAVLKNHSPEPWEQLIQEFIELTEAQGISAKAHLDKYQTEVIIPRKEMKINGDDLLSAGMPAGPRIKNALDACYLEILREPNHNNLFHLLEVARQY
jgi:tRNA nucleotidyltransferase (CCA-adding enzyme)